MDITKTNGHDTDKMDDETEKTEILGMKVLLVNGSWNWPDLAAKMVARQKANLVAKMVARQEADLAAKITVEFTAKMVGKREH